ncbi:MULTISPECIES: hypothetical protein [Streptomyces]|uniref:hypothetical protein n=1 Tax=Streptomyces TaxID=1883 RepID=UPI0022AAB47A|nr:hypothetical protein [Streptomyces sp. HB2AG]MCZ2523139.1 hypothetical protein [Streptomyces sp. HB2AG]
MRVPGAVGRAGKPACGSTFSGPTARRYLTAGARFPPVGADVTLLARGSEALAARFAPAEAGDARGR